MQPKYLETLEYPKILERLAEHTSFSAGRQLALSLTPSVDYDEVVRRQWETTEAKHLLDVRSETTLGAARDVRPLVHSASLGAAPLPADLLSIRNTLASARTLRRVLVRLGDQFPLLAETAELIEECPHVVEEISRCLNDQGDVVDAASSDLGRIRREMHITHDRLLDRLNKMITSPAISQYLQESLVTLRGGRYVIPLKADFKGRLRGIIHDQSGSGATLFIEPLATVELNNRWRELQLQEEQEVNRILLELGGLVSDEGQAITRTVERLAELDLAFTKARYSNVIHGVESRLLRFDSPRETLSQEVSDVPPGMVIWLREARHPLLPTEAVVPIDVHLGGGADILLITGPNTGGKTVTLKTIGLLALMAQAGLHIPASEDSAIAVFDGVFADIGDEQSIEQNLSTFSSHMTNIIQILDQADKRSLVLLDELGAGTDPVEGAALARSLLERLKSEGIHAIGTTHYSELKLYAHNTDGVENASVEFDIETLSPTFKVTIGLPGRSQAFAIAGRLGLSPEIIDGARQWVSSEELQVEQMLNDIKAAREESQDNREAAKAILRRAKSWEQELRESNQAIEDAREAILNEARAEARRELEETRKQLRRLSKELTSDAFTREWLAQTAQELDALVAGVKPLPSAPPDLTEAPADDLQVGDTVWVPSLQQQGALLLLDGVAGEVSIGRFRVRVRAEELELVHRGASPSEPGQVTFSAAEPSRPRPGIEMDIRGMRVEEALPIVEKYLDDAYLAGMPFVRIIHGKGSGILRKVVREKLAGHPLVSEFRSGEHGEGDTGVTVIKLANQGK